MLNKWQEKLPKDKSSLAMKTIFPSAAEPSLAGCVQADTEKPFLRDASIWILILNGNQTWWVK